jgi:hypothetical protein
MGNEQRIIECKKHAYRGEEGCLSCVATVGGKRIVPDPNTPGHFCPQHSSGVLAWGEVCPQCVKEREARTPSPPPAPPAQPPRVWVNKNDPRGI